MGRAVIAPEMRFLLYIALCTVFIQINKTKAKHFLIETADNPTRTYDEKLPVPKYKTASDYSSDYSSDYMIEQLLKDFMPSTVDEAFDKIIQFIPSLKDGKEPIIQLFKALEPVLQDLPGVLKNLVDTFKEIYTAFVEDKDVSSEDAVKWKDAIQRHASPMLKKLARASRAALPPMKGIAWFDVDAIMDGMTLFDGEIKTAIRDKLKWGQEVLKPIIQIMDD